MNIERPHDLRRFADGERIPDGYTSITEDEFKLLEPMTVDERAEWMRHNKELAGEAQLRRLSELANLTKGDQDEDDPDALRDAVADRLDRRRNEQARAREQRGRSGKLKHNINWPKGGAGGKRPGSGRR